jgi:uncharacterized protein YecE (DUF72 family)
MTWNDHPFGPSRFFRGRPLSFDFASLAPDKRNPASGPRFGVTPPVPEKAFLASLFEKVSIRGPQEDIDLAIIGTAAWSVPKALAHRFSQEGSALTRYASVFDGVEVNSTFYRRHKRSTFERWANSVPDRFRFAVKIPREITHDRAMGDIGKPFEMFLEDIAPLGAKLGPLLCQLPPSLEFGADKFEAAFRTIRDAGPGPVVIEVRHKSWNSPQAIELLREHKIARVLADPAPVWPAEDFGDLPYYIRLHGRPKIYYSSYTDDDIRVFSQRLAADGWCVFDNTASGAAIENAMAMLTMRAPFINRPELSN